MCHFITMVFSCDADLDRAKTAFPGPLEIIGNRNVRAQLGAGELHVRESTKHCDCGTVIGSAHHGAASNDTKLDSQVAKLKKKGWGEAKIEQWLENKRHAAGNRERKAEMQADITGTSEEAVQWVRGVTGAIEARATKYVGLLLHWYRGALDNEAITIQRRVRVRLRDVQPGDLARFEEDVLYVFAR